MTKLLTPEGKRRLNRQLLGRILREVRPSGTKHGRWFNPLLGQVLAMCPASAHTLEDPLGNRFVLVGDSEQSDVAFTSHLDTVARPGTAAPVLVVSTDNILSVDNKDTADCLGADCGAGIYLMLEMIAAGVHGRYCFFVDEEIGCVGSQFSANDVEGFWTGVKAMISFDRRGDDIISMQIGEKCCSATFAMALALRLDRPTANVKPGVYTDSASFTHIIPECTNIGVGYRNEHTPDETLDLNILEDLLNKVLTPGTFANLPIMRVATKVAQLEVEAPQSNLDVLIDELSLLGSADLLQWVKDSPKKAAVLIAIYTDYGFLESSKELGNEVVSDWGGLETFEEDYNVKI